MRANESREAVAYFLPGSAKVAYRDPAGMDSMNFLEFCIIFVREAQSSRRRYKKLVLTKEKYGGHTILQAFFCVNAIFLLLLFRQTKAIALKHSTIPFYSRVKTFLRNARNEWALVDADEIRIDIYIL